MSYRYIKGIATTGFLTWIAGGSISLLATVALAYAAATSTKTDNLETKVSSHDTQIQLLQQALRQSTCLESQNWRNAGKRLQIDVVTDPNCNGDVVQAQ